MARKMDEETRKQLQTHLNCSDGVFETICNAIDYYFEANPQDDPREGEEFIEWNIEVGEILDEDD